MKTAIIGAGTCGLYLAWKLSEKGEDVTVFEKNNMVGNKVCSGLFSERILEFVPKSKGLIEKEINSVVIHFPKKTIRLSFSKRFLLMDHSRLDSLLLNLAKNRGAKIVFNQNISEMPKGFDRIIGCDGANSFIRRKIGLPEPFLRLGIQGFVKDVSRESFVEAWPCRKGFLWKIPRKNQIEYGIIADANEGYRIFTDFLRKNKVKPKNIKARVIPQGLVISKKENVALCGDAAGLTKPWSGGGVIWGLTAANFLIDSFPDFQEYSKKVKRFFTFKILTSKTLTKAVYFFGFHFPFFLPKNRTVESDFLF